MQLNPFQLLWNSTLPEHLLVQNPTDLVFLPAYRYSHHIILIRPDLAFFPVHLTENAAPRTTISNAARQTISKITLEVLSRYQPKNQPLLILQAVNSDCEIAFSITINFGLKGVKSSFIGYLSDPILHYLQISKMLTAFLNSQLNPLLFTYYFRQFDQTLAIYLALREMVILLEFFIFQLQLMTSLSETFHLIESLLLEQDFEPLNFFDADSFEAKLLRVDFKAFFGVCGQEIIQIID